MFILSKRNVIFRDGAYECRVQKDYVGDVPEWVTKTPLFGNLVADGLIIMTETAKQLDKAVVAAETPKKAEDPAPAAPKTAPKKAPAKKAASKK